MSRLLKVTFSRFGGKYKQIFQAKDRFIELRVNVTHDALRDYPIMHVPPTGSNPNFNVLFVTSTSDLKFLKPNIENLKMLYPEINEFIIVTPDSSDPQLNLLKSTFGAIVYSDQEVIGSQIDKTVRKFPSDRRGWLIQQFIKTKIVYDSDFPVLVVDADTFLLKKFEWFGLLNSQLFFLNSSDFHFEYNNHFERCFEEEAPLLNFVNHVQLQFPSVVKSIYGNDLVFGWCCWLAKGKRKFQGSPVSEFQTYGLFSILANNTRIKLYNPKHKYLSESELPNFSSLVTKTHVDWDLITVVGKTDNVNWLP